MPRSLTTLSIHPPAFPLPIALADANAVKPGKELYTPQLRPGSSSFDQVSIFLNSLNINLDSLILPDNASVFLSNSLLATLALNILLSASLAAFQAGVLKKIILHRGKETEEKPQLPVPAEDKEVKD